MSPATSTKGPGVEVGLGAAAPPELVGGGGVAVALGGMAVPVGGSGTAGPPQEASRRAAAKMARGFGFILSDYLFRVLYFTRCGIRSLPNRSRILAS
jgi:hypothetical protein